MHQKPDLKGQPKVSSFASNISMISPDFNPSHSSNTHVFAAEVGSAPTNSAELAQPTHSAPPPMPRGPQAQVFTAELRPSRSQVVFSVPPLLPQTSARKCDLYLKKLTYSHMDTFLQYVVPGRGLCESGECMHATINYQREISKSDIKKRYQKERERERAALRADWCGPLRIGFFCPQRLFVVIFLLMLKNCLMFGTLWFFFLT